MQQKHWLVSYAENLNQQIRQKPAPTFLKNKEYNDLIIDLKNYPHAFVLACIMDRQVDFERAWAIPCVIKNLVPDFSISYLASLPFDWYVDTFKKHKLHRYDKMAKCFYSAVVRIQGQYDGDVSKVWANCPSSAAIIYRFLEFDGIGIKIATMITNLLYREFHIPMSDLSSIDISPDAHVKRIFTRCGLILPEATPEKVIYKARELNVEYPGIIDSACWTIGREYCHSAAPACSSCPFEKFCPKLFYASEK